jgi:hypothetical protein
MRFLLTPPLRGCGSVRRMQFRNAGAGAALRFGRGS